MNLKNARKRFATARHIGVQHETNIVELSYTIHTDGKDVTFKIGPYIGHTASSIYNTQVGRQYLDGLAKHDEILRDVVRYIGSVQEH